MADTFGLKIGLEGEKEFKKALTEINRFGFLVKIVLYKAIFLEKLRMYCIYSSMRVVRFNYYRNSLFVASHHFDFYVEFC